MYAYLRFEVIRTLRNKRFLMFVIGMPTFIYLINAGTHNGGFHEDGLDLNAYFLGSMLTYAAMGGAMATSG
ncbi:MAG TPA: hypothetical protein VGM93_01120, partial [Acidimicrobiales bacterium]